MNSLFLLSKSLAARHQAFVLLLNLLSRMNVRSGMYLSYQWSCFPTFLSLCPRFCDSTGITRKEKSLTVWKGFTEDVIVKKRIVRVGEIREQSGQVRNMNKN